MKRTYIATFAILAVLLVGAVLLPGQRTEITGTISSGEKPTVAVADMHGTGAAEQYMATFNKGRPFVLIGHSQGAQHLLHLLQDEFDNDPTMTKSLVSAMLIGWPYVTATPGGDVGGSLKHIPLCRTATQNGGVITYDSFGPANPRSFATLSPACTTTITRVSAEACAPPESALQNGWHV